jgi:hypothetical protein
VIIVAACLAPWLACVVLWGARNFRLSED